MLLLQVGISAPLSSFRFHLKRFTAGFKLQTSRHEEQICIRFKSAVDIKEDTLENTLRHFHDTQ